MRLEFLSTQDILVEQLSIPFKEYIYEKSNKISEYLHHSVSEGVFDFIRSHIDRVSIFTKVSAPLNLQEIKNFQNKSLNNLISINKINDIRYINKFFNIVNEKLFNGGVFIGCAETKNQRKERILNKYPKVVAYPYYCADFILKRVFPKFKITLKLYFLITKGRNRVLAKPEILGRLISCGFEIIDCKKIEGLLWFVVKKIREPYHDFQPSYGALFKMRRIGQNGKIIYVYKIRTMYPYSEYLQEYVYKKYGTMTGDKFENDFRITHWGKVLRKYWLDELPMIINWLKRDLKLVGVRPLSIHKFNTYPKVLQEKRIKYKPGLFPPYYAEMPKNCEDFFKTEERYLNAYEMNPFLTDFKYFFKILSNIIIKRARSS